MSEKKTYKDLKITPYELSELDYVSEQKHGHYSKKLYDYGTGEKFTPVEVHFVTRIYMKPGITVKDIANMTKKTRSAVSQIASKLEQRGYIKRQIHPEDGRQIQFFVTEKGARLSEAHIKFDDEFYGDILNSAIEKYGFEAVENYITIFNFFVNS